MLISCIGMWWGNMARGALSLDRMQAQCGLTPQPNPPPLPPPPRHGPGPAPPGCQPHGPQRRTTCGWGWMRRAGRGGTGRAWCAHLHGHLPRVLPTIEDVHDAHLILVHTVNDLDPARRPGLPAITRRCPSPLCSNQGSTWPPNGNSSSSCATERMSSTMRSATSGDASVLYHAWISSTCRSAHADQTTFTVHTWP